MSSPAAGACVLVVLGGGALAVVYAVSPTAAVFTIWGVGAVALWRSARRRMSDSSATPPPSGVDSDSDIAAARRRAKARGVYDPNGVMCILHAAPEEVNGP